MYPRRPRQQSRDGNQQRPPSPPLGPVLTRLSEMDLDEASNLKEQPAKITDCEDVASYNVLNKKKPTILVPGKPPAWTPLKTPVKLKEDSGEYFRDVNAARYPEHPIEPAVQAIWEEQDDFSTSSIDVLGCGSTFGSLLTFVRKIDKPFRFLVEVVGNTVFFVRKERSPTEVIPSIRGYGHTFPEAYTTWEEDVRGSESHQRIVKYKFGGLTCLVRFESDGYLKHLNPASEPGKPGPSRKDPSKSLDDADPTALTEALRAIAVRQEPTTSDTALTVQKGGQRVPQAAVFDLKTRAAWKKEQNILTEEIPRLWVRQIPNFVVAYHTAGVFDDIRIQSIRDDIDAWESKHQDELRRLAALLRKIVAFAKSRPDGQLELRRSEVGVLELREPAKDNPVAALPASVRARWAGHDQRSPPAIKKEVKSNVPKRDASPTFERPAPGRRLSRYSEDYDDRDDPYRAEEWPPDYSPAGYASDEGSVKSYTACSASDCGYCGHCRY